MDMVKPMAALHSSRLAGDDIATVWPYTLTNPILPHDGAAVIVLQRPAYPMGDGVSSQSRHMTLLCHKFRAKICLNCSSCLDHLNGSARLTFDL
jgi:hypothetical protein